MFPVRLLYPLVSADVAIFSVKHNRLQVLLVQRAHEPAREACRTVDEHPRLLGHRQPV